MEPNQILDIDRVKVDVGSTLELTDVLLIKNNGEVRIGTPLVAGARVLAEVIEHGRDDKIRVFKYKNKTRYRRRFGHRQQYTRLAIRRIVTGAEEETEAAEAQKPKRAAARKRPARGVPATEAEPIAQAAEAPSLEAPEIRPARRARATKAQTEEGAAEKPPGRARRSKDAAGSTERKPAGRTSTRNKSEKSGE